MWCLLTHYWLIILKSPVFRSVQTFRGAFQKHGLCDKNVSVFKFLARMSCMWKQPQIMVNLSGLWWREETSWLSHVVAYYPSKSSSMCSAHTSAQHSDSQRTAALPLDPNASHPLKDTNIVFGEGKYEMSFNGEDETVICLWKPTFFLCGLFKAGNTLDLWGIFAETSGICLSVIETFL